MLIQRQNSYVPLRQAALRPQSSAEPWTRFTQYKIFPVVRVGFVKNMYRIVVAKNLLEGCVTWTMDGYEYSYQEEC
jgi:hypothetical protein